MGQLSVFLFSRSPFYNKWFEVCRGALLSPVSHIFASCAPSCFKSYWAAEHPSLHPICSALLWPSVSGSFSCLIRDFWHDLLFSNFKNIHVHWSYFRKQKYSEENLPVIPISSSMYIFTHSEKIPFSGGYVYNFLFPLDLSFLRRLGHYYRFRKGICGKERL